MHRGFQRAMFATSQFGMKSNMVRNAGPLDGEIGRVASRCSVNVRRYTAPCSLVVHKLGVASVALGPGALQGQRRFGA